MNSRHVVCLSLLAYFALIGTGLSAQNVDRSGPTKTLPVFHRNQVLGKAGKAVTLPFNLSVPVANFGGPPYKVGPTVTPVNPTSFPEAEEHAAADPLDSKTLVAAISDFSQRGGFNTTAYVFSQNDGTSWTEQFIPENTAGFPTTSDGGVWQANSDPVVAIDTLGNVYIADLYLAVNSSVAGYQ